MNLSINYIRDSKIGIFHLEGIEYQDDFLRLWCRILRAIKEDDIRTVLAFDNARKGISATELLKLDEYLSKLNFPRQIKVAFINVDPSVIGFNEFKDCIASLKGWNIKIFNDETSAREWLKVPLA